MKQKQKLTWKHILLGSLAAIGFIVLFAQLVPYGRAHNNPPVLAEPAWDSPQTRALFMRACGDCHSNETAWPWYTNLAPVSWLIQRDVDEGRSYLNISEWGTRENNSDEAAETFQQGEMPPRVYLPLHPSARLSATERQELLAGLTATFGGESGGEGDQESEGEGD